MHTQEMIETARVLLENGRTAEYVQQATGLSSLVIFGLQQKMQVAKPDPVVVDEVQELLDKLLPAGYTWAPEDWEWFWHTATVLSMKEQVRSLIRPETKPETKLEIAKFLASRSKVIPRLQEKEQPAVQINQDNRSIELFHDPQFIETIGESLRKIGDRRASEAFHNIARKIRSDGRADGPDGEGYRRIEKSARSGNDSD